MAFITPIPPSKPIAYVIVCGLKGGQIRRLAGEAADREELQDHKTHQLEYAYEALPPEDRELLLFTNLRETP